jgi:hypothetical protein
MRDSLQSLVNYNKQGSPQQQMTQGSSQQPQSGQQNKSGQQCQNCTQGLSQGLQKMSQGMGQQSQNPNGNPNQNPSNNQMQQGAQQASQQLQQLAQMQQQMQQMRSQQSQLNQSMGQMAQNCNGGRNSGFTPNMFQPKLGQNSPERNNGTGGPKAGTGEGGNPLGQERHMAGYNTEAHSQATDGEGRVIASWMENGPMAKNAPVVEFNKSVTQARQEAEKAITEDRLPRQYQKAVHDYFNQMPQSPEEIQKPSAPAAPR